MGKSWMRHAKVKNLPLEELNRFRTLEEDPDAYYWCVHCERAYPVGMVRRVRQARGAVQLCPYDGCDGDTVMDARPWREVRSGSMPEIPEWGVEYSLYGEA